MKKIDNIDLDKVLSDLHKFNFGKDGIIHYDVDEYSFKNVMTKEGDKRPYRKQECAPQSVCNICGKSKDCGKEFSVVTHGTHTLDFLDALSNRNVIDQENWSNYPVIFVMENPGPLDKDQCFQDKINDKLVRKDWYWITDQKREHVSYPKKFDCGKKYGELIYSIINTFKLANAYVTNMVKCGMTTQGKSYLTTDEYCEDIVNNCIGQLKKEIDCLKCDIKDQKVIVFAFGERTYNKLEKALKNCNVTLCLLPHPVRPLKNEFRKYVLFVQIFRALSDAGIYDDNQKLVLVNQLLETR